MTEKVITYQCVNTSLTGSTLMVTRSGHSVGLQQLVSCLLRISCSLMSVDRPNLSANPCCKHYTTHHSHLLLQRYQLRNGRGYDYLFYFAQFLAAVRRQVNGVLVQDSVLKRFLQNPPSIIEYSILQSKNTFSLTNDCRWSDNL